MKQSLKEQRINKNWYFERIKISTNPGIGEKGNDREKEEK